MGFFITDTIGLIIAFLNVTTFLLLLYLFLLALDASRSRLMGVLDTVFRPVLAPIRSLLPEWKIDISPMILAVILQLIVFVVRKGWPGS